MFLWRVPFESCLHSLHCTGIKFVFLMNTHADVEHVYIMVFSNGVTTCNANCANCRDLSQGHHKLWCFCFMESTPKCPQFRSKNHEHLPTRNMLFSLWIQGSAARNALFWCNLGGEVSSYTWIHRVFDVETPPRPGLATFNAFLGMVRILKFNGSDHCFQPVGWFFFWGGGIMISQIYRDFNRPI